MAGEYLGSMHLHVSVVSGGNLHLVPRDLFAVPASAMAAF